MPFLLRAAIIGGGAYAIGKRVQGNRDVQAEQNAQIADLQQQQAQQQQQQQQAPAAAPAASQEDQYKQLTQLKSLLDQGVLTQAEFDAQKTRILQGM